MIYGIRGIIMWIYETTELYHHGIKGQKWGEKNGPPYPLGKSQMSYAEKKRLSPAGGKIRITRNEKDLNRKHLNDYNKITKDHMDDFLGPEEYYKSYIMNPIINSKGEITGYIPQRTMGKNFIADLRKDVNKLNRLFDEYDKKSNLPLKNKDTTPDEDLKVVNPGWDKTSREANYMNCAMCTLAYELRRRGYDVIARQNPSRKDLTYVATFWYKFLSENKKVKKSKSYSMYESDSKKEFVKDITDILKYSNNGDRGFVRVGLTDKNDKSKFGHIMNYEIIDNEFRIMDSQSGKNLSVDDFFKNLKPYRWEFNTAFVITNTQYDNVDFHAIRFAIE